jgi:hypothetical protein
VPAKDPAVQGSLLGRCQKQNNSPKGRSQFYPETPSSFPEISTSPLPPTLQKQKPSSPASCFYSGLQSSLLLPLSPPLSSPLEKKNTSDKKGKKYILLFILNKSRTGRGRLEKEGEEEEQQSEAGANKFSRRERLGDKSSASVY